MRTFIFDEGADIDTYAYTCPLKDLPLLFISYTFMYFLSLSLQQAYSQEMY